MSSRSIIRRTQQHEASAQGYSKVIRQALNFANSRTGTRLLAGLTAFLICLSHGVATAFVYDANNYWSGAVALTSHGDVYTSGLLDLRGTLTVVIYLPSAVAMKLFGAAAAGALVLIQNALLIAALGALVLPSIIEILRPAGRVHIWASAITTAVVLAGFAQYPLMDVWGAAFALLGLLLLMKSQAWWSLMLGGLALGVAINLRPAYAIPALLAFVVWLAFRWRRGFWPVRGAIISLVPQVLLNHSVSGVWDPWPVKTPLLSAIQSIYASFSVRYDTVAFAGNLDPRQTYCDPSYAKLVVSQSTPSGASDLAASYLHNLPDSIIFAAEKISGSLFWSAATPYAYPAPQAFSFLTPIVIVLVAVGVVGLVRHSSRPSQGRPMSFILLAFWAGTVATVVFSQPETRFATPLILLGIVGCLASLPAKVRLPRTITWIWAAGAAAMVVAVLLLGHAGLSHPAPPGDASAQICSGA